MGQIDITLEKANRLVELLREAKNIIDSLNAEYQKDVCIELHQSDAKSDDIINKDIDRLHTDFTAILQEFNIV